jgi:hypothetical protein
MLAGAVAGTNTPEFWGENQKGLVGAKDEHGRL